MEALVESIYNTPIIDNHAHNLLEASKAINKPLLSITSEAAGPALEHAKTSLPHLRAVKQLSQILNCGADWDSVQKELHSRRQADEEGWARQCFEGIETVLIDDGLDKNGIHPYGWHDRLTRSKCKRILRIETLAEDTFAAALDRPEVTGRILGPLVHSIFKEVILEAIANPDIVGFKSIICYRYSLNIPSKSELEDATAYAAIELDFENLKKTKSISLKQSLFNPWFLHVAAELISKSESSPKKPLQFHTGLGDNDITLSNSSPACLQSFIREYPTLPIILLHAGYPYTREGAYLATVYENVYLDIGEVFPMVSQTGQEELLSQALEICPSEKLLWSTDGHWFAETYLLAIIQFREALSKVLCDWVSREVITSAQGIQIVQDLLFNTANKTYGLGLKLKPLEGKKPLPKLSYPIRPTKTLEFEGPLQKFIRNNRLVKFIRVEWLDYSATRRMHAVSVKQLTDHKDQTKLFGVGPIALALLHGDRFPKGLNSVGELGIAPSFASVRRGRYGKTSAYGEVKAEVVNADGTPNNTCPRTRLRQTIEEAKKLNLEFTLGFELEVVFVQKQVDPITGVISYGNNKVTSGHAWSTVGPFENPKIMELTTQIVTELEHAGIELEQFHTEGGPAQLEFVLGRLPALTAVDTMVSARTIIYEVASQHDLKATFVARPFTDSAVGTGAHMHLSLGPAISEKQSEMFYAGVLKHLKAIVAFTLPNPQSYLRVVDSAWSGGRYVAWGTQNRQTPLRRISTDGGSHWEFKSMDGFANPYLAALAILNAGMLGLRHSYPMTWKDCLEDPALLDEAGRKQMGIVELLPPKLEEALGALEYDKELTKAIGKEVVELYGMVKWSEIYLLEQMNVAYRRNWLIDRY
jgi:glutamine synthetase